MGVDAQLIIEAPATMNIRQISNLMVRVLGAKNFFVIFNNTPQLWMIKGIVQTGSTNTLKTIIRSLLEPTP